MNESIARAPPWTEAAVGQLRRGLLDDALTRLARARTFDRNRRALMAWVLSDAIHPFSFRVCALASGYDADTLSEGVLCQQAPEATTTDPTGNPLSRLRPATPGQEVIYEKNPNGGRQP
jgi:hypothetical protein